MIQIRLWFIKVTLVLLYVSWLWYLKQRCLIKIHFKQDIDRSVKTRIKWIADKNSHKKRCTKFASTCRKLNSKRIRMRPGLRDCSSCLKWVIRTALVNLDILTHISAVRVTNDFPEVFPAGQSLTALQMIIRTVCIIFDFSDLNLFQLLHLFYSDK